MVYNLSKQAMFIEGEGDYVIAFNNQIWLTSSDGDSWSEMDMIANRLKIELTHQNNMWDLINTIQETRPDVLMGQIENDTLRLDSNSDYKFGPGSHLLKKVIKELGIEKVEYLNQGENYRTHYDSEIQGNLPDVLYHGTTSENAIGILRFGLMPGKADTNYPQHGPEDQGIEHDNTIFLTDDLSKAEFHAVNAVTRDSKWPNTKGRKRGFCVVFQFKVPDKNLLVPDYDIENMSENPTGVYEDVWDNRGGRPTQYSKIEENPMQFSRQVGVFGYQGRIPASFINKIMIAEPADDKPLKWHEVNAQQFEQALDYGDASFAFYEMEEDEEEDNWCPECRYEYDFCQCNKEIKEQPGSSIKTAEVAETKAEVFLIHDIDRYTSDDIAINIAMQETKNRYSVGIYSINYKVGVSGYHEYWHYDKTQRDKALDTYHKVVDITKKVVEEIEIEEIPFALSKPYLMARLYKIDPGHKERSGVISFNWYATENMPEEDWRQTLYGGRYPGSRYLERMNHTWNSTENSSNIEANGKGRKKNYHIRYSSKASKVADHIQLSGRGWNFVLGLSPSIAAAFLLWATQTKNLSAQNLIQQAEENPHQISALVDEFKHQQTPELPDSDYQEQINEPVADNFSKSLEKVLKFEGGYVNDPKDHGGETNLGITKRVYQQFLTDKGLPVENINMRNIPMEHVNEIYRTMYWDTTGCNELPDKMAMLVFDFAVNSGPQTAVKQLQKIVGAEPDGAFGPKTKAAVAQYINQNGEQNLIEKYIQARKDLILNSKKIHNKFKKGLLNRIESLGQDAKPMPIKPDSPKQRAKNPPESLVNPLDTQQVQVFAETKAMPLDPGAYAKEPKPHRLMRHLNVAPTPYGAIHQKQDADELEELYYGVHATQSPELASVYANNRGTKDDPPVIIEFATTKQWQPDVDAARHYIDHIHDKVLEMEGLKEAILEFERTNNVDWEYINDVLEEIQNDKEWPDEVEGDENWKDLDTKLQRSSNRGTLSSLAEFFMTFYREDDERQQTFDHHIPRYLLGFYEWYLVPLVTGEGTMDSRITAWFLNQMRFMEPIEEDEILAIYSVERYNPEVVEYNDYDEETEPAEEDEEGRRIVTIDDMDYWTPSRKLIWKSPNKEKKNVPVYYHGTSLSRAQMALSGILDVKSAASELMVLHGNNWGKIATALRKMNLSREVISHINREFLSKNSAKTVKI